MVFFSLWWHEAASAATRDVVRSLIAEGRLEIVSGGWVMHDEACTTFEATLDQFAEGHLFARDTLGARPRRAWQVDPFGAGLATPSLLRAMGFESTRALVIRSCNNNDVCLQRISYRALTIVSLRACRTTEHSSLSGCQMSAGQPCLRTQWTGTATARRGLRRASILITLG